MKILSGDIGGTKTLLRISEVEHGTCELVAQQRFESNQYESFEQLLAEFVNKTAHKDIENVCIGVAGPVSGHTASVTNLPWQIHSDALIQHFGFHKVRLVNDFQAVGYGLNGLPQSGFLQLQSGQPQPQANQAIIGAGTGLGEAMLVWQNGVYEVLPSEGGHVDFAPTSDLQIELLQFMRHQFPVVSYELLCSGPGLERIYAFIIRDASQKPLPASEVTSAAVAGDDYATQALDLFMAIYGAQAGNLALTTMALGGLYVAGGIAPRISEQLQRGPFLENFKRKSKMQSLLENIPVSVVLDPQVGLLGAEEVAAHRL